uniref:Progestin and adipoQ receptor family member 5 n=1 Tax=Sus scrofa TaxID=9823 RepID=A0A8D1T5D9_PIG
MLLQMALCHSFLWLRSIPLCIYTTSSESNHLSMDIWVVSMSWQIVNSAAMNTGVHVSLLSDLTFFKYPQLFLFPGESAQNEATMYHQKHMAMTLLASFFYSAHLPERLAPGRFDYIGHSHQLFHVCVILATHMQMEAILLDKSLRKEWLLANCKPLLFPQIAGAILLCLIFSLSNIIYFSAALYRIPEPELHKKET